MWPTLTTGGCRKAALDARIMLLVRGRNTVRGQNSLKNAIGAMYRAVHAAKNASAIVSAEEAQSAGGQEVCV